MHSASGFVVLDMLFSYFLRKARLYRDAILIQLAFFTVLDTLFSFTVLFPKKEQLSPIKAKYSAHILFVILIQFWLSGNISR